MYLLKGTCNLPDGVAETIGSVYTILLFVIPIIVIIIGLIDLAKAAAAGKEEEIKKNQSLVIKRIIISFLAFFILGIIKLGLGFIKTNNTSSAISCITTIFG